MGYYIEANSKACSSGKWIFENVKEITRTKVYKTLDANKVPFTVYKFNNFYDQHTEVARLYNGAQVVPEARMREIEAMFK